MKYRLLLSIGVCVAAALPLGAALATPFTTTDVSIGINDSNPSNSRQWSDVDEVLAYTEGFEQGFVARERANAGYGQLRAYSEMTLDSFPFAQSYGNSTATFFDDIFVSTPEASATGVLELVFTVDGVFNYGGFWNESVELFVNGIPYDVVSSGQEIHHRSGVNLNALNIISAQLSLHVEARRGMSGTSVLDFQNTAVLTGVHLYKANGVTPIDFSINASSGTSYPVPEPQRLVAIALGLVLLGRLKASAASSMPGIARP